MKQFLLCALFLYAVVFNIEAQNNQNLENGIYKNPVLFADYSDPDNGIFMKMAKNTVWQVGRRKSGFVLSRRYGQL
jgi:hypothetical protein